MAIRLGKRLQLIADTAAECAEHGKLTVLDVGCDHAHVPIYLLQTGGCQTAIGMDVADGPLEIARTNLELSGLSDRCEIRKSDGLAAYTPGEAQVLVIAGMGGILMQRILTEDPEKTKSFSHLVLSPHSEPQLVRSSLRDLGIGIQKEKAVVEDGKYYCVIVADPGKEGIRPDWEGDVRKMEALAPEVRQKSGVREDQVRSLFLDPLYQREMEDTFGPCLIAERDSVLRSFIQEKLRRTLTLLQEMLEKNQTARAAALAGEAGQLQALLFQLTLL